VSKAVIEVRAKNKRTLAGPIQVKSIFAACRVQDQVSTSGIKDVWMWG